MTIRNPDESMTDLMALMDKDEELCPELQLYICKGALGPMIHHPLIIEVFYRPSKCAFINHQFMHKQRLATEYLDQKEWAHYIFLIERPYRIDALLKCQMFGLTGSAYWELVGDVWTDTENLYQNIGKWKHIWRHNSSMRELCMDEEERTALAALPNELTVWRGTRHQRSINSLSWTLDRDKAIWFAQRYNFRNQSPRLVEGFVHKKHVLAHFLGRGEQEIVSMQVSVQRVIPLPSESVAVRREESQ